jgi:cholesterol oxidase
MRLNALLWNFGYTPISNGKRDANGANATNSSFSVDAVDQEVDFASCLGKLDQAAQDAGNPVQEILFDVPGTAHCIGGCVIADSSSHGVVDSRHRVFGYKNMYICDGSVIAANLGVNPSLTITALAERAISFIPPAGEADWNDAAAGP